MVMHQEPHHQVFFGWGESKRFELETLLIVENKQQLLWSDELDPCFMILIPNRVCSSHCDIVSEVSVDDVNQNELIYKGNTHSHR